MTEVELGPPADGPAATVASAMRYAVLGGGKRLRPVVALAACGACGGCEGDAIEAAAALELVHTYSLVHDDLPSMDDDDLRRGRPTTHRAFGEAAAILAGDALLTLAFEVLAEHPRGDAFAARRAAAAVAVARRAGLCGMVGGQIADLEAEGAAADAERLAWIHRHKTGALFAASAELGAIIAGAGEAIRGALSRYGAALGLAFQIADDVLDCTASAATLGKTPGKHQAAGKTTYPSLYGIDASRARADALVEEALAALAPIDGAGGPLAALARHAVSRSS
jgi:geranylgeranyl diphosphate synthase type II